MKFSDPLTPGRLIRRYKRFLSDIALETGETVIAHCANPGSMIGLTEAGAEVWLSPNRSPTAKLGWRWELIHVGGHLVGVSTAHPNNLVEEALEAGRLPELAGHTVRRREVRYGRNSRIDFLLDGDGGPPCYVEVKNVNLRRALPGREMAAEFPDAVTKRGAKHLVELAEMAEAGARAVMLYIVQRGDCDHLRIAADIDPAYAAALVDARRRGVEILCYVCDMSLDGIDIARPLPLVSD